MRHPETEERPGDATTPEQTNSTETTPSEPEIVQIYLNMVTTKSEPTKRQTLAAEIAQRHRVEPFAAHSVIEEALLSEVLVPAGDSRVSLNPALFGQTWDEWGEQR